MTFYIAVACLNGEPVAIATEPSATCEGLRGACAWFDENIPTVPGTDHRIFKLTEVTEEECPFDATEEVSA
jgi:hypothetical protein